MKRKAIYKDYKKRLNFALLEQKRIILNSIRNNISLTKSLRFGAMFILDKLPIYSSRSQIRNRCIITGRGRSVYSPFGLSRIQLRNSARFGILPGVRKINL
uniref:Ribosomal protein S14 n=1 Tax=Colponema vietnamica TaxID=1492817 RepID=V5KVF8_9ALVE|nr:ribosomal protein S14 [Colponema vietnamica]ATY40847.1 ribosomal protein S14 [Colponema vietnamica]